MLRFRPRAWLLTLLLLAAAPAGAETAPTQRELGAAPAGLMWIGNSFFYYNNGITSHLGPMIQAAGRPAPRGTMITMGGSGFDWHDVDSYFRPDAVGRYRFDAQNVIHFNPPGTRPFDTAVLMDCSQCPLHPQLRDSFFATGRRHAETVRRHGARPVFFMSWAYQDHPEMTAQLAEAYTTLGNETGALVIPAGLAFARALAQRPGLVLHIADKRHPTLAGTYLAAATSYAALFSASPESLSYTAGLEPELAGFLRRVAWETVQAYYRRGA
jgi:hypothetical protein